MVEELDPFIEEQVRALGLPVIGKEAIPANGELDQEIVFRALEPYLLAQAAAAPAPGRAAGAAHLQPACSRRPACPCGRPCSAPAARTARCTRPCADASLAPMGDIGCYTLGALPPLLALDSCLCMGASVGMMAGFNKALGRKAAVAVIGDSTFFHSGVSRRSSTPSTTRSRACSSSSTTAPRR